MFKVDSESEIFGKLYHEYFTYTQSFYQTNIFHLKCPGSTLPTRLRRLQSRLITEDCSQQLYLKFLYDFKHRNAILKVPLAKGNCKVNRNKIKNMIVSQQCR